jgi:hypothetical protein
MTDHEIEILERDARRPNYGSKYYSPEVVLQLIEELKKRKQQIELFPVEETPSPSLTRKPG